ncbi:MAG: ABC transporter ATP-binding protein [Candidatus Omnitrophica bacterium]|nr:ABC transporter ATP-binding protein [Candidatus Omnitrophota bacterium]MBU1870173.1 ABC transporter ATP-binding protein [Candidatus Omnitrophota bacterium]
MKKIAIEVKNLGKSYRIGETIKHDTLRDAVSHFFSRALKANKAGGSINDETIWALKDVSFEIAESEAVGIIGRNGAGKSTLLKILSRITEPTEGYVRIRGRVSSLLEVGTGFHQELTGRENIFLNSAILGMTKREIRKKFDEIVGFAEIEKFIDTPVKRYSSGMYVRLAFAVAAHLEPEILLVDEVLAVGDAAFQKKCLGKMSSVAKEGRTVLFVSHNMGAVASLCTKGIVLESGKIKAIDNIDAAISAYMQSGNALIDTLDLRNHQNRAKGSKELLTSLAMDIDNATAFYSEPLTFRIGYDFKEKIATPQFCIIIKSMTGVRAFTLVSNYQPSDIPSVLEGKGEVVCRINSLPLLPGRYSIDLKLWQPGEKIDDIENVANFQVEWLQRNYGQFNWDSSMGVVYVDAKWNLSSK